VPGTLSRALARPQTRAPPGGSVEFTHCGTCCRPRDCEPTSVEDRHFFCDETTVLITVVRCALRRSDSAWLRSSCVCSCTTSRLTTISTCILFTPTSVRVCFRVPPLRDIRFARTWAERMREFMCSWAAAARLTLGACASAGRGASAGHAHLLDDIIGNSTLG